MKWALLLPGSALSLLSGFAHGSAESAAKVLTNLSFGIGDLTLMMATMLLTLVAYNLLVFLKEPRRDYFYFCSFGILTVLLVFCGEFGASQKPFLSVFAWPLRYHAFMFTALAAALQFQLTLIPVRALSHTIWSSLQLLKWLALTLSLLSILNQPAVTLFLNDYALFIGLAFTLVLAASSLKLTLTKASGSSFFLTGWLVFGVGLSLTLLARRNTGSVSDWSAWLTSGVYIGATLSAAIFSLALPAFSNRRFQQYQQGYQQMEASLQRQHNQRQIYHDAVRQYLHNIPSMDEKSVSIRLVEVLCDTLPLKTCAVISSHEYATLVTAATAREQQFFERSLAPMQEQLSNIARHGQTTSLPLSGLTSLKETSFYAIPVHWNHTHWILVLAQPLPGHGLDADQLQLAMDISNHACTLFMASHNYRKLQHEADADSLTGVLNRRAFFREARTVIHRLQEGHEKLGLLYMDIDLFKSLNDNHGHAFGDHVLKQFTEVCRDNLRDRDMLARFGGEEFVVLLPKADLDAASCIAERIRHGLQSLKFTELDDLPVTVSIGVVSSDSSGYELRHMLARADKALYRAKTEGRNRIVAADSSVPAS